MVELEFSTCFPREKVLALAPRLDATYRALDVFCSWRNGQWPQRVECMSKKEIVSGRSRGAGHGFTFVAASGAYARAREDDAIWMNPHMTVLGYHLVLIHENLHHGFPDATEEELNNVLVPYVFTEATGRRLTKDQMRKAGLGPPQPGIGDRGYVY